jgi:hypothetical protein
MKNFEFLKVERVSPLSGETNELWVNLDMDDYADWMNGKLIQDAMPYLTPDEREFIKTGITAKEWDTFIK